MADLSDVENALLEQLTTFIYPNGVNSSSLFGKPVRLARGLFSSDVLLEDRARGVLDVSVYSSKEPGRNTTRWGVETYSIASGPGVTASYQANQASYFGTANPGDLAGVLFSNMAYIYQTKPGDTGYTIAAGLAVAISARTACSSVGNTLIIPGASRIIARTAGSAQILQEIARQEKDLCVTIWAGTPAVRDEASSAIASALQQVSFLTLADNTGARLRYKSIEVSDQDQASSIYRRDIVFTSEYGTTVSTPSQTVLFPEIKVDGTLYLV